jgi:hypothetical protein
MDSSHQGKNHKNRSNWKMGGRLAAHFFLTPSYWGRIASFRLISGRRDRKTAVSGNCPFAHIASSLL